jgi:hypothetical protein
VAAGGCLTLFADAPDGGRGHGPPELAVGREHPAIPVRMLPRWRLKIGEPVHELERRKVDDAVGSRPRGLLPTARADPVGGLVSREHVVDFGDAAF